MANKSNKGIVTQIIGPVLDIRFEDGCLPNLNNAVVIEYEGRKITLEVAQHIGDSVARCIAMTGTEGLPRGIEALDTGAPISVPVGRETLGRIFNLLGECVDNMPTPETKERWAIHRPAPAFVSGVGILSTHSPKR